MFELGRVVGEDMEDYKFPTLQGKHKLGLEAKKQS